MTEYKDFVTVTGYGVDALGLCGINCYHSFSPFIEGISVRSFTDEQLDEMNAAENVKKEYKGKEYTTYEATQQMRKLERIMRAQVQKIHLLEEGGADNDTITAARSVNRATQHEYAMFAKEMNLKEQMERVGIISGTL